MMPLKRSVPPFLAATAGLTILATLSGGALAAPAGPETPVREAYAITTRQLAGSGGKPVAAPWQKPHRDRLMSRELAALFARDELYQEEAGEMGNLGADPFLNGQDGEVRALKVVVTEPPANGKAQVTASFRSFKQPVSVRFRMVEEGDLDEALGAAAAVGDDRLQRQAQGRVVPDSFTHGTSAQRASWFRRGYGDGDLRVCDTFGG